MQTTNRMTCLSAGKIPKNETVQSEKKGLQREELNWTWAAQTLVYLTPVLQEQVSTAGQVSTRLLGRFDHLSPLCELTLDLQSPEPISSCSMYPSPSDGQWTLQASRRNADPLAFGFSFHCTHTQGPPSSQLTREPRLAQMEMQLTLLLPLFCLSVTACRSHWSCISPLRQEKCLSEPGCSLPALVAMSNRWCPHHLLLITCAGKWALFEWSQELYPLSPEFKISSFLKHHWCCFFCFFSLFILWTPLVQQNSSTKRSMCTDL